MMTKNRLLRTEADPMGAAIRDFHTTGRAGRLRVLSPQFDEDEIPVSHLFRTPDELPAIEAEALRLCRGRVLDVGETVFRGTEEGAFRGLGTLAAPSAQWPLGWLALGRRRAEGQDDGGDRALAPGLVGRAEEILLQRLAMGAQPIHKHAQLAKAQVRSGQDAKRYGLRFYGSDYCRTYGSLR